MRKSAWLISAGLTILATPALAQTAQSNTDTDKQTAQPTPGGAEGAAVQDQARQQQPVDTADIIVTATRRNQALSDVPLAVSAVTAQNLQNSGATDIRQLNQLAPSLLVSSTTSESGAAVARIRGIGTVGDNPGLEGSVGVFIDGVYRSRTGMGLTDLGPVDRIEVLRGPQGTLFGRNTSAGLISVITAKPRFQPEVSGQIDVGNYDYIRVQTSATGPITDTIAARVDAVFAKRDGFLKDVISGRDVNDRNRGLLRGQLLFQPSDAFSFRLIADYSRLREECCAAPYLPTFDTVPDGSGGVTRQPSTIAGIERALGAMIEDQPFRRKVSITPGRDYDSDVNDGGVSGEAVYDMGWGELTSITAYRYNKYTRGQDADFNNLDILYRDSGGGSFNRFKTFTQELRLQGNAFNNHLDWLVGGYYANEKLRVDDNLAYGNDYTRFTNCVLFANVLAAGLNPAAPGCVSQPVITGGIAQLQAGITQLSAAIAQLQAIPNPTPAQQAQLAALIQQRAGLQTNLSALSALNANPANPGFGSLAILAGLPGFNQGSVMLNDSWNQTSNNWALFTHNIISFTDRLKLTVGARYTHEQKKLAGDLNDNNTLCVNIASSPLVAFQQLPCVIPGVPGGHLDISDKRTENKVSGTVVLSYKPTDRLLTYASYTRGYKAGGFNLDRSALFRTNTVANGLSGSGAICINAAQPNCQGIVASGADLQFKPEINDAFEIGAKYKGRGFDINLTVFHQLLRDFQLNTFNGLNFIVENINSCSDDLGGADTDNDPTTGACTGKTRAGVKNTGFELEAFTRPMPNLAINGGVTMANTKYRDNLVGADGKPLSNALWQLPGRQISNAPKWTITGSAAWTPPIGSGGMHGLLYADIRHMSQFNTGSDLDIEKTQKAFNVVNARAGIRGPDDAWALEIWGQNIFNKNFIQVAFDSPIQGTPGSTTRAEQQVPPFFARATQLYNAFLGEPRTFGVTLRGKLGWHRPAPPAYVPPPPPPPPPPATQTCPDGSVILATDTCPAPPPPPPPPAPAPERG
jgi:outer membrane receptor protein involved in Fe transport